MSAVVPLLLVPGWSDRARQLDWLRRELVRAGYPLNAVRAVDFRDRFGSNLEHAAEIGGAIDELCASTRSTRVDVVAHSMGGLALRYYLHFHGGGAKVRRVVFTGTPHRGTWVAYLAWGKGAREMRPGHSLLRSLSELPPVPAGVSALCIHTPLETRVIPRSSARLADVRSARVWSLSHPLMLRSRKVLEAIRSFLNE